MLKMMIFIKNNTKEKREKREKQNSRYEVGKIIQKGKLHSEKKLIKREKRWLYLWVSVKGKPVECPQ